MTQAHASLARVCPGCYGGGITEEPYTCRTCLGHKLLDVPPCCTSPTPSLRGGGWYCESCDANIALADGVAERDAWRKLALARAVLLAEYGQFRRESVAAQEARERAQEAWMELIALGIDGTTGQSLGGGQESAVGGAS